MQLALVHHKGLVGIEQHQVGGRALGQRAGVQAQDSRRRGGQRRQDMGQAGMAIVMKAERGRQQRLQPHRAERGGGESLALGVGALRLMAGDDHVDHAATPRLPPWRRGRLRSAAAASPCGRCNRRPTSSSLSSR